MADLEQKVLIREAASTAGYSYVVGRLSIESLPDKHQEFLKETFGEGVNAAAGKFFNEVINIEEFTARAEKLRSDYAKTGVMKDIETGRVMTHQESQRVLNTLGLILGVANRCGEIAVKESNDPMANMAMQAAVKRSIDERTKEFEKCLSKGDIETLKKKSVEIQELQKEFERLQKENAPDAKVRAVLSKIFTVIEVVLRLFLTFVASYAVFGTMTLSYLVVGTPFIPFLLPEFWIWVLIGIVAVAGDRIWIVKEIRDFLKGIFVGVNAWIVTSIMSLFTSNSNHTTYGESAKKEKEEDNISMAHIDDITIDPVEVQRKLDKVNTIPEHIKDIVDKENITDFTKAVKNDIIKDIKEDIIEASKEANEDSELVSKVKSGIADDLSDLNINPAGDGQTDMSTGQPVTYPMPDDGGMPDISQPTPTTDDTLEPLGQPTELNDINNDIEPENDDEAEDAEVENSLEEDEEARKAAEEDAKNDITDADKEKLTANSLFLKKNGMLIDDKAFAVGKRGYISALVEISSRVATDILDSLETEE